MPFKKDGDTRRRHPVSAEAAGISPELQETTPQTLWVAPPSLPPANVRHHDLAVISVVSPWSMSRGRENRLEGDR